MVNPEPDQIDMLSEVDLRFELRKALGRIYTLENALERYITAGCMGGTHFVNQKAALDNALTVLSK